MSNLRMVLNLLEKHQFHIVKSTQLPMTVAFFIMLLLYSTVLYLQNIHVFFLGNTLFHFSFLSMVMLILDWFLTVMLDAGKGYHTKIVIKGLSHGFWLFLASETLLFFSFFWAYFHFNLNSTLSLGFSSPAESTQQLDVWNLPLYNTIILLLSGVTMTVSHRIILNTQFNWNILMQKSLAKSIATTFILGYIFMIGQFIEYKYGLQQDWTMNSYWSMFYLLTSFHGFHVIIGTFMLQTVFFSLILFIKLNY